MLSAMCLQTWRKMNQKKKKTVAKMYLYLVQHYCTCKLLHVYYSVSELCFLQSKTLLSATKCDQGRIILVCFVASEYK